MVILRLNYRRRIAMLQWLRRGLLVLALVVLGWLMLSPRAWSLGTGMGVLSVAVAGLALKPWELSLRRQFIRDAHLPSFLVAKVMAAHPDLTPRDADLVLRGLRQFFMAHLRSGRQFVAMPSKVVDTAWHEFILHTQAYQRWCQTAFGGMLHHTPAEVLGRDPKRNDGLRRVWFWSCREESIDPRQPTRLPLLFALDGKFRIEGGFSYRPDCKAIEGQSGSTAYCGTDFSEGADSGGAAGDAHGLGGSEAGTDGSAGDGCGGGCGGGGD